MNCWELATTSAAISRPVSLALRSVSLASEGLSSNTSIRTGAVAVVRISTVYGIFGYIFSFRLRDPFPKPFKQEACSSGRKSLRSNANTKVFPVGWKCVHPRGFYPHGFKLEQSVEVLYWGDR